MNKTIATLIPRLIRVTLPGIALRRNGRMRWRSGNGGNAGAEDLPAAYAISGTVTGLTGSGLVLHNGADDLVVTAAGPFFFSTALDAGQSYDVTVQSQPSAPAQHCTVANGSGTAGTNDPSKVTVSCSASTGYTVGGTVTGLTGSGLILDVIVSGAQPLASVPVSTARHIHFSDRVWPGGHLRRGRGTPTCFACPAVHRHRPVVARSGLPMSPVFRSYVQARGVSPMPQTPATTPFPLTRSIRRPGHLRLSECPWPRVHHLSG